jgi:hypothetical protein
MEKTHDGLMNDMYLIGVEVFLHPPQPTINTTSDPSICPKCDNVLVR